MARMNTFTFRVNKQEQQMIEVLARRLQRTQSDAVRLLVREAFQQLDTVVSNVVPFDGEVMQDDPNES